MPGQGWGLFLRSKSLPPVTPEKAPTLSDVRLAVRDPFCVSPCKRF
jgi:hypothetical protein